MIKNKKRLIEILSKFNTSNNILKYTTHGWDFVKGEVTFSNLDEFLLEIKEEFDSFDKELLELSPNLHNKIKTFLFNKDNKPWGMENIMFGWSSPTLKKYEDIKHYLVPFQYVLDDEYRKVINNKSMDRFSDVAYNFKNEIEFRSEEKKIKWVFRTYLKQHKIRVKFINLDWFDQYEDIETFYLFLKNIFDTYNEYGIENIVIENKNKVIRISPIDFDKEVIFDISDFDIIADYSVEGNDIIIDYKSILDKSNKK